MPISNDLYSSKFRRSAALFIEQEAIKYKNRERTKIIRVIPLFYYTNQWDIRELIKQIRLTVKVYDEDPVA